MTLNPFKWWSDRKTAQKQEEARAGKNTSGHLDSSERAALFSKSRRLPK